MHLPAYIEQGIASQLVAFFTLRLGLTQFNNIFFSCVLY